MRKMEVSKAAGLGKGPAVDALSHDGRREMGAGSSRAPARTAKPAKGHQRRCRNKLEATVMPLGYWLGSGEWSPFFFQVQDKGAPTHKERGGPGP